MSEQTSMEEILAVSSDVEPPKTDDKPEPKAEAAAPEPEVTDDSADAASPDAAPSKDDTTDDKPATVPHEALHAEREKRKAERAQFEELKAQNAQLLQLLSKGQDGTAPKAEKKPAVSFNEDPEAWMLAQLDKRDQATQRAAVGRFFDMSEASAIRRHGAETYKDAMDWFGGEAEKKPFLIGELNKQQDPGEWLVNSHKRHTELLEVGNPGYREKLEQELRAKWDAEQTEAAESAAAEAEAEAAKSVPQPRKSLAKARSTTGRTGKATHTGPTPIDQILPGR